MVSPYTARTLKDRIPGAEDRSALAAVVPNFERNTNALQETSDAYARVEAKPAPGWRVVTCKDQIQWILQRRKKGGAERPWRGVGYFRTKDALIKACASLCGRVDPAAMAALAALPQNFGGMS